MHSGTKIVTFQAPVALAEKLRVLADGNDRSLSAEVRRACDLLLRIEDGRDSHNRRQQHEQAQRSD